MHNNILDALYNHFHDYFRFYKSDKFRFMTLTSFSQDELPWGNYCYCSVRQDFKSTAVFPKSKIIKDAIFFDDPYNDKSLSWHNKVIMREVRHEMSQIETIARKAQQKCSYEKI